MKVIVNIDEDLVNIRWQCFHTSLNAEISMANAAEIIKFWILVFYQSLHTRPRARARALT